MTLMFDLLGMRGPIEECGPCLRPEDPEQVGDVEEGGNGVLSRGKGCSRLRRQTVDHKSTLRIPRCFIIINYTSFLHASFSYVSRCTDMEMHLGFRRYRVRADF